MKKSPSTAKILRQLLLDFLLSLMDIQFETTENEKSFCLFFPVFSFAYSM